MRRAARTLRLPQAQAGVRLTLCLGLIGWATSLSTTTTGRGRTQSPPPTAGPRSPSPSREGTPSTPTSSFPGSLTFRNAPGPRRRIAAAAARGGPGRAAQVGRQYRIGCGPRSRNGRHRHAGRQVQAQARHHAGRPGAVRSGRRHSVCRPSQLAPATVDGGPSGKRPTGSRARARRARGLGRRRGERRRLRRGRHLDDRAAAHRRQARQHPVLRGLALLAHRHVQLCGGQA